MIHNVTSDTLDFIQYDDDTTPVSPVSTTNSNTNSTNHANPNNNIYSGLSNVSDWSAANKLSLNTDKTKYGLHKSNQIKSNKVYLYTAYFGNDSGVFTVRNNKKKKPIRKEIMFK